MNFFYKLTMGIALSVTCLSLAACDQEVKPKPKQTAPILVSATTINKREVPIFYEYAGRITAYRETEVRARVGGILLHRNFVEGNEVNEGDVLFEIDPAAYQAEVARQEAAVAQAQATYDQSLRDATRAEELLRQRVWSAAQRDQAFATRDVNAANLKQAQAMLQVAELNLQYTKVTAPISGFTAREAVSVGSLIAANGLLTSITKSDPIYVNFSYTDTDAKVIEKIMADMAARGKKIEKLKVKLILGNGIEYSELGVIDFTSPTLDSTTGTIGVRAVFNNLNNQLVSGQFVRVIIVGLTLDNSTVIPENALMQNANSQFVFVVGEDSKVEKRLVKVLREVEGRNWLLQPAEAIMVDAPFNPQPASNNTGKALGPKPEAGQPNPAQSTDAANAQQESLKVEQIVGLKDGEHVVTDGLFVLQQAFGQLPNGVKLPVTVTRLDGKPVAKPQSTSEINQSNDDTKAPNTSKK